MNSFCQIVMVLACFTQTALAGWDTRVLPKMTGVVGDRYVMIYETDAERGMKSIEASADALAKAGHVTRLRMLTVHALVEDETFQREVFEQMEKMEPEVLKAARDSAGNMHNPKMIALRPCFAEAVMATPTVQALNQALGKHRMKIARALSEKLMLRSKEGREMFGCFLWLDVEPVIAQTGSR